MPTSMASAAERRMADNLYERLLVRPWWLCGCPCVGPHCCTRPRDPGFVKGPVGSADFSAGAENP